ncbi:hypothetical protein BD410DRAFT_895467 [Rickenella mellea]|uniref:LysM domain-containing protein n=1 Tax=Rickenella mellea TaxID=50990 RepID=A0A4Y7QEF5_9AGAM|nr:hypothetical protein BD410DRAFT_895467 [Rickenella mellea]
MSHVDVFFSNANSEAQADSTKAILHGIEDTTSIWASPGQRFITRKRSGTISLATSGLRSRKSSSHRRTSTFHAVSHPLQSSSSVSALDAGVTRPRLRSWLSSSSGEEASAGESSPEPTLQFSGNGEEEADVIVHRISPKDSIAGVALKYGVSVAALRKANQLWASDSIHLRQVLHIPLKWAANKHRLRSPECTSQHLSHAASVHDLTGDPTCNAESSTVTIQRIPMSKLAFFPPSTQEQSSAVSKSESSSSLRTTRLNSQPSIPAARPLSTLFNVLPLPSPDSFMSRLSIDSASNDSQSVSNRSESPSDHEMDVMGLPTTPRKPPRTPRANRLAWVGDVDPNRVPEHHDARRDWSTVRTEQLKPSPQMELPKSLLKF